jgi:branched-chain amino acid transport system substrate-binding protein
MNPGRAGIVSIAANLAETRNELETIGREWGFNSITVIDNNLSALEYNKSEALYLATDGVTAGKILLALHQANISLPVLGQVDVGSPQTLQVARTAANGLIFASPGPDPNQVSQAETFKQAYQALAGFPPGPRAVLAYDAAQVLLDGIEQSLRINDNRPPRRTEMSATIKSVQRQGLSGEIRFDRQGWRVNAPVWIYQIRDEIYPGVQLTP